MGKFIDRTGQIYKGLKITEELGNNQVKAQCIKCNYIDIFTKGDLVKGDIRCRKCGKHFINRVGEVHGELEIVNELGNDKVAAKCIKCGSIDNYYKSALIGNRVHCKHCDSQFINRVGEIHNNIIIIEELGKSQVRAQCMECKHIDIYNKKALISNVLNCKKCKAHFVNHVGEVHNNLKIIEELGKSQVKAQCLKCGCIDVYIKQQIIKNNVTCTRCGVSGFKNLRKIEGLTINNIEILKYSYRGRDKKFYYTCKCNKCGEELLLNYDEVFVYQCDK